MVEERAVVFIIDDDPSMRLALEDLVSTVGLEVRALAEMRQAIKEPRQSKAKRFDAIVELVRRYDAGELKPQSIAARQRAILAAEKQIRPL
jgi:DNA-binding NtrC family response regulator